MFNTTRIRAMKARDLAFGIALAFGDEAALAMEQKSHGATDAEVAASMARMRRHAKMARYEQEGSQQWR